jgi:ABC-type polysaccharide/polyol phosphate export permease
MSSASSNSWPNLWHYRFALLNLVLKDFRIRYRNMALGIVWSVVNPLVMLGVLLFIFTFIWPRGDIPYFPIFILLGLLVYNFFSMCITTSTTCILNNGSLMKKAIFPRILIPLSVVLSQVIHLVIQLGLLVLFLLLYRVPWTWGFLWLAPIYVTELVFVTGLALICSTLNVYFRDVQYVVESSLTVLFWFTPIFYDLNTVYQSLPPWVFGLYIANPMAGLIDAARKAIIYQQPPDVVATGAAVIVSMLVFAFGVWFFARYQRNFADRI